MQLGNIACLHNFLGGLDEEWFRLIHVQIEQQAAAAVAGLPAAQAAAAAGDAGGVRQALEAVTAALLAMQVRMERCCSACVLHGGQAAAAAPSMHVGRRWQGAAHPELKPPRRPRWAAWARSATLPYTTSGSACP